MLTDQDIKKLSAVLATKEDIKDLREENDALRENVHALITKASAGKHDATPARQTSGNSKERFSYKDWRQLQEAREFAKIGP